MGASCSKLSDLDDVVLPEHHVSHSNAKPAQQEKPRIPNPSCPIHGIHAQAQAPAIVPATATPVSTGPLPKSMPTSPVSIRVVTSVAAIEASNDGNDALRLRTPATGFPAEKQQQQQQQQQPPLSSSCVRKRGGGIRKTGLQLLRPVQAYVVGEPATLKVAVRNAQAKVISGATLTVLDNGYFAEASSELPEIGACQTLTVEVTAKPKRRPAVSLKDVKGELEMQVTHGGKLLMAERFLLHALDFGGDLMPPITTTTRLDAAAEGAATEEKEGQERFLNIYLLGAKGSGKTSFLHTLSSALLQTPPPAPGIEAAPTTELNRVNFARSLAASEHGKGEGFFRRPFNVRVFDLWGMDASDASALDDTHSELPAVLAGQAPIGFTAAHRVAALSPAQQADLEATKSQRAADAVLFFVAPADVNDPGRMEVLKEGFEAARAALGGHSPLVVLGRMDQVQGAEPLNGSNKKVAVLRKQLASAFNIPWAHTFVALPYCALPAPPLSSVKSIRQQAPPTPLDGIDSSSNSTLALSAATTTTTTIGPARNFEVDRQALLIARAALEAAWLRTEGKAPPVAVAVAGHTPWSASTPACGGVGASGSSGVRRLPTVELSSLDGSFSSNFHASPHSAKARAGGASIAAIAAERSEEAAP